MRRRAIFQALLVACTLLASAAPAAAQTPPQGFSDTLVASVASPTALAFTPGGDMLVTSQGGKLWLIASGTPTPTLALDFNGSSNPNAPQVCTNGERGLLGVAIDPDFASSRAIYLYYTANLKQADPNNCELNNANAPVNRVSRFTLSPANSVSISNEVKLLDNIPSPNGNHNGGDLHFGKDGYLYVSVGDGGCDYKGDSGCAGGNDAARDRNVLSGKILRISKDGGIPPDNPFVSPAAPDTSARCNLTGRTSATWCQETFAWGLRNPFRLAFDPNAQGTRFFINDVGQNVWEEIDEGKAGADYGWNDREGFCVNAQTTGCRSVPDAVVGGQTDPLFAYKHGGNPSPSPFQNCNSITGGAFVPRGLWPAAYDGAYLFGDYVCGRSFTLTGGTSVYSASLFAGGVGPIIHLTFGPYQSTQALYYTTYSAGGQVRRVSYTGSVNRAPSAVASADKTFGPPPLAVQFSASGSSDPDGNPLGYSWSFGDGSASGAGAALSHTYATTGTYTATLTVSDGQGGSASAQVRIDVGNSPPQPRILAPASDARFVVGEQITLQGSATDAEDSISPTLTWEVRQYHVTNSGQGLHFHPYLAPTSAPTVALAAPAPEDLDATAKSYLELRLTATDSRGLSTVVTQTLRPKIVSVSFASQPSGHTIIVNGTSSLKAPATVSSWQGYRLQVAAPNQQDSSGRWLAAAFWLDGVQGATRTITTTASATTYTAVFSEAHTLLLAPIMR